MKKYLSCILTLVAFVAIAQEKDKLLAKGTTQFKEKEYVEAEINFRKSFAQNPIQTTSAYNLGNTIYTQKQFSEAKYAYVKVIETSKDKNEKHRAYHNLGNVFMKEKKYSEAVEAYKNALRNNPNDEETRYNYALAKKMLKDNPEQNDKNKDNKKDQDKQNQKNQEDNKQNENKNQDKKEDKNQNQQNQPKNQEEKPQEGKFSKQRMESLLEAVNNEEKKVQEKVNLQKVKANPVKQEKDW